MSVIHANVDLSALGIYNVKHYGALGNGTGDDSPFIQAAINAAYLAGGGIVYLPSGTYLLDGGSMTVTPGQQGNPAATTCNGLAPMPAGINFAINNPPATQYYPPNCPVAYGGTLPADTLPNGPLLLFDNVILQGDGPEQTILLAGPNFYNGYMFCPAAATAAGAAPTQAGALIASMNWWASYMDDTVNFADGYFGRKIYIRQLSVDCNGQSGTNAGKPSHLFQGPTLVANPFLVKAADGSIVGQLTGNAIVLQDVLDCGVEDVWLYDGNVHGIAIIGTQNHQAWEAGPVPISYAQKASDGSPTFVSGAGPQPTFVPVMRATVTRCVVDMNYPVWLAGSSSADGGTFGQFPIRSLGAASVTISSNKIGQRNIGAIFPSSGGGYTSPAPVGPGTNDAIDCEGSWHILVTDNLLTNCGDGIGADGNGDMIVTANVMSNFGSVGFDCISTSNKSCSQTVFSGNTIFLGDDFGSPQQGVNIDDPLSNNLSVPATATPGSNIVSNNVFYGSNFGTMIVVKANGTIVTGNILDYAGVQPLGQPGNWPIPPSLVGVKVAGNDIIVSTNIFRNADTAGTKNTAAVGIQFPMTFPPALVTGDSIRVLIDGNIFDDTIGTVIQYLGTGSLVGVRILDNAGFNPLETIGAVGSVPASPFTFQNPFPYDCFVTISVPAASLGSVSQITLNGTPTGATIQAGHSYSLLVKAGGSVGLTYTGTPIPNWTWIGL